MRRKQVTLWLLGCAMATTAASGAGDPERGRQLSEECFACHGEDGNSPSPINPKIGGQHEAYLFAAMQSYLTGARADSLMRGAVLNKSEQDLRDIAAYFAKQGGSPADQTPNSESSKQNARKLNLSFGEKGGQFMSMLARARSLTATAERPDASRVCTGLSNPTSSRDADQDGVPDDGDAAPNTSTEFAADRNGDGFLEICNAQQLAAIGRRGQTFLSSNELETPYQLARNIDGSEIENLSPIGDCGPSGNCMVALGSFGYAGTFVGHGYEIRNLTISDGARSGVGLFGVLAENGVVANVRLSNLKISGRAGVGGLVGSNFGTIINSTVQGTVDGALAIGGVVGGNAGLLFDTSIVGAVSGQQAVGGLVGDMTGAVFYGFASAQVRGKRGIGGLVGLSTSGRIMGSASTGQVKGEDDIGGLVGVNTDAAIRMSQSTAVVEATGSNIGGLAGFNSLSRITNSFASGNVSGQDGVGGLVGRNNGEIENAYARGTVTGPGLTGAIAGVTVGGSQKGTFASAGSRAPYGAKQVDLAKLTGQSSGWAPTELPYTNHLLYFCDNDLNGLIDTEEHDQNNYVWQFGSGEPSLRCVKASINTSFSGAKP